MRELAPNLGRIEHSGTAIVSLGYERRQVGHPLGRHGGGGAGGRKQSDPGVQLQQSEISAPCPGGEDAVAGFRRRGPAARAGRNARRRTSPAGHRARGEALAASAASRSICDVAHWPRTMPQYHVGHQELGRRDRGPRGRPAALSTGRQRLSRRRRSRLHPRRRASGRAAAGELSAKTGNSVMMPKVPSPDRGERVRVRAASPGETLAFPTSARRQKCSIQPGCCCGGCLAMFMHLGFALVETGLCRAKNTAHTMSMNLMVYVLACLAFWGFGFALGWELERTAQRGGTRISTRVERIAASWTTALAWGLPRTLWAIRPAAIAMDCLDGRASFLAALRTTSFCRCSSLPWSRWASPRRSRPAPWPNDGLGETSPPLWNLVRAAVFDPCQLGLGRRLARPKLASIGNSATASWTSPARA